MHLRTILLIFLIFIVSSYHVDCKKTRGRGKRRRHRGFRDAKPNIILILADDLDIALGSPNIMKRTQRLLKEGGTEFVNTFVTSSICCPSRSSILTGKYSHNHKINSNAGECAASSWQAGPERFSYGKLLQDAGYTTGYFGKYLNQYDGSNIPIGWDEWYVQQKNSLYYNYTINHNGRRERRRWNYERDYSTNVFTDAAMRFFRRAKLRDLRKPVLMTVSYAAPHGSEDPAPQHSKLLKDVKAPRDPSFNKSSHDKHWIIKRSPPISDTKADFIDLLHRRRLLTLLSLDEAIARLYQTVRRLRLLDNTYLFFSSDHGYHLGQFRMVKGKSQPYDTDIRVPLYVFGPGVPVNKTEKAIALNIDLVPTFLDIAEMPQPDYIDGSSLLSVLTPKKKARRKMRGFSITPWRDSFLVERTRMSFLPPVPDPHPVIRRQKISRGDSFTQLFLRFKVNSRISKRQRSFFLCTRQNAPTPPCTPSKRRVCVYSNGRFTLVECPSRQGKDRGDLKCTCRPASKQKNKKRVTYPSLFLTTPQPEKIDSMLRRAHGTTDRQYFRRLASMANLPNDEAALFAKLLVRMKRKYRKRSLRKLTARDLKFNEISLRIREAKRRLEMLRERKRQLRNPIRDGKVKQRDEICTCKKEEGRRKRGKTKGINCFYVNRLTWKTPPRWHGPNFISCTNTANNSYLCLRTINTTHNFLYCKFVTGFYEYYDMNKDPYQTKNIFKTLERKVTDDLDRQIRILANCKGERECTITAGRRPDMIVRPAIRRNFIRARYARGKYNWAKYLRRIKSSRKSRS